MRALVTGSRGTVGTALRRAVEAKGGSVVAWDRASVPLDDYGAMLAFIEACAPDVLFHLAAASQPAQARSSEEESWRVNYEWSSELAWICRELELPFVFTSTVMVFEAPGPYSIGSRPDASGGYGREKASAEARVFRQNPYARVARLGWQIGRGPTGNQMAAWAWAQQQARGQVEASLRWVPACSFLEDSASALMEVAERGPGLYHVDSNDGHSFYDVLAALREREDAEWELVPSWERAFDQRLLESRLRVPRLGERLG
ncbi:MAG: sugar nucleotide-binding protein [Alphaproteobacteria bacterium]|nr:sugar nucleotide-binding protein [Alphaproteobacteria bacterium]